MYESSKGFINSIERSINLTITLDLAADIDNFVGGFNFIDESMNTLSMSTEDIVALVKGWLPGNPNNVVAYLNPPFSGLRGKQWINMVLKLAEFGVPVILVVPESLTVGWFRVIIRSGQLKQIFVPDGRIRFIDPRTKERAGSPPGGVLALRIETFNTEPQKDFVKEIQREFKGTSCFRRWSPST